MGDHVDDEAVQDGWARRHRLLLGEYERVALTLFAARGYHQVTMDDIAAAAGVTTRTLFRYFPSKQDCLLGFARRGLATELELIEALEPAPAPVPAAWEAIRSLVASPPVESEVMDLWSAATAGAPDVVARVRGERIDAIHAALVAYGERCLGVEATADPGPALLAGVLAGVEFAVVEAVAGERDRVAQVLAGADELIERLTVALGPVARGARPN